MKEWDHIPTEKLVEMRDFIFHANIMLKPEAQAENMAWHKILCQIIECRKKED